MNIKRHKYLNDLVMRMNNGMIKVVTGIRRSGKSYLLFEIFQNYLQKKGVPQSHIISIELDQRKNRELRNPDNALEYINSQISDKNQYYLILDEVQMLTEFEEVLNSLLHIKNLDIYVTSSNSKFLSKDVITEFRGRGDEIHIYPLTFKEYMQVYDGDIYHGWSEYYLYGGLPLIATMKSDEQKITYLMKLFQETYFKDLIERKNITKTQEFEELVNILASSIGSLINPYKIEQTFQSVVKSKISINTIKAYLQYLEEEFIVAKAYRYNVKGRKYIGTPLKYYFEDVGLRNARLGFRQVEESHIMENIIFNELRSRGYNVDVGVVDKRIRSSSGKEIKKSLEIDFVANLGSKRFYIQSELNLNSQEKLNQDKASLLSTNDSFKKIIVVKDVIKPIRDENGIVTISLYDFLLNENSLEL